MRSNLLAFILGGLLLGSCASTQEPLSYRQQLDVYKDMKIRLYKVAAPIKVAGVSVCSKTGVDDGILTHRLSDYPKNMRTVAQSYWELKDDDTILFEKETCNILYCYAPMILDYDAIPNAYTDGESIFVTPALLNDVDDLALSLIIAHELGHIVLKHKDYEQLEKLEREADRFALYILARAGLDYKKVALQDVASRQPHSSENHTYPNTRMRAVYFRTVIAEIKKLETEGKPIVP